MRVGLTSFTRMLSDTSIASMIVDRAQGSVTRAVGRARASSSTASASSKSAGGTCRRQGRPDARRATLRLLTRSAGLPGRRSSHRYSAGSKGSASINHRFWGHRKLIGVASAAEAPSAAATKPSQGRASNADSGGAAARLLAPRARSADGSSRRGAREPGAAAIIGRKAQEERRWWRVHKGRGHAVPRALRCLLHRAVDQLADPRHAAGQAGGRALRAARRTAALQVVRPARAPGGVPVAAALGRDVRRHRRRRRCTGWAGSMRLAERPPPAWLGSG